MKIVFFDIAQWEEKYISEKFKDLKPELSKQALTLDNIDQFKDTEIISISLITCLNKEIINLLPKLKYILIRATGFDNIDIEAAKQKNIIISNIPIYAQNTVAEHAFALILCLTKKIIQASQNTKQLNFSNQNLVGTDLNDKTLGVIGVGHIGQNVIRIANGFGMKVIAYEPKQKGELAKKLNFEYANSIQELLSKSDIISLHAPYNKHTHHLINKENIKLIKPNAILINTARGELVETEALVWALDNNILSAAGLDVLEAERDLKNEKNLIAAQCDNVQLKNLWLNHQLLQKNNVIITPHNAFNTKEALHRILQTTEENVRSFLNNKPINTI